MYAVVRRFLLDVNQRRDRILVATDLDGTIASSGPFEEPRLDALAVRSLRRLAGLDRVEVVVLSGRTIDSLTRICAPLEGAYLVADHGAVIQAPDGTLLACEPSADVDARDRLWAQVTSYLPRIPGLRVQAKPRGVLIGLRNVERLRRGAIEAVFRAIASRMGATVFEGKHWFEARLVAATKGEALETLLEWGAGDAVVCAGDDPTDDATFNVARRRRSSLIFHIRSAERPAARTYVDAVLPDRARFGEVLADIADALERGHHETASTVQ